MGSCRGPIRASRRCSTSSRTARALPQEGDTMPEFDAETVTKIADLAREGGKILAAGQDGAIPFVIIPDGCKIESLKALIDTDRAARPLRIKATVTIFDAESFARYFHEFADQDSMI